MMDKGFNGFKPTDGDQLLQSVFIVGSGIEFLGLQFAFEVISALPTRRLIRSGATVALSNAHLLTSRSSSTWRNLERCARVSVSALRALRAYSAALAIVGMMIGCSKPISRK